MTVQKLAGDANAQSVSLYDRRGESAKKQAVKALDIFEPEAIQTA